MITVPEGFEQRGEQVFYEDDRFRVSICSKATGVVYCFYSQWIGQVLQDEFDRWMNDFVKHREFFYRNTQRVGNS